MIRKIYKNIYNVLIRRRYRKLYCRLFWFYAKKYSTAEEAGFHAAEAFLWITGYDWSDWARYFLPKIHPPKEKEDSCQRYKTMEKNDESQTYRSETVSFESAGYIIEYSSSSLTLRNHKKNLLVFKILKALGFSLHPTWVNSEKGGLLYFSASALPLRWKSPIEA